MVKGRVTLHVGEATKGMGQLWSELTRNEVLVGVPESKAGRRPVKGQKHTVNNAMLAYIHDNGSPLQHIPARPFLSAGIKQGQAQIVAALRKVGEAAARRKPITLDAVGLVAANAVKRKITNGPFAPLSPRTIAARMRRGRKGLMRPLIDTGQLRAAITYVIVRRTKR